MPNAVVKRARAGWEWWVPRAPSVSMCVFYAGCGYVGALGFFDPGASMATLAGGARTTYAVGMVLMSVLALISVTQRSRRSEAVCIVVIGLLTVIQGLIVASNPDIRGMQTGVRLVIAVIPLTLLAYYRSEVVHLRRDLRRQLDEHERREHLQ